MQNRFEKKVEAFIREQQLITQGDCVLVGLSGGADSVCLLVVLQNLAEKLSFSLAAYHLNHGIRGAEADRDETFAKELCQRFGIPFLAVKENVPELSKKWKLGLEEAGRKVRYQTAERLAEEHGYTKIALAHQQNDVAETLLFHLFRGSSVGGLASIPAKRGKFIRPLLSCGREEVECYLEEREISYCTDSTNEETEYTRNKIRHNIVAYVKKEINPGAVRHMAETAAACAELEDFLSDAAEKICAQSEKRKDGVTVAIALLKEQHTVLQRKVVHCLLAQVAECKKDITKEHIEAVLGLLEMQSGKKVSLPYGLLAEREFEQIVIRKGDKAAGESEKESQKVQIPGEYVLGEFGESLSFRLFSYKKNTEIPKNEYTKWFDYDKIKGTLCLRTYRTGDLLGMVKGKKTVKSIWTEKRVPIAVRNKTILLADEEQVVWIPGVRCCDNYRVEEDTKTVLEIRRNGGKEDGSECEGSDFRG